MRFNPKKIKEITKILKKKSEGKSRDEVTQTSIGRPSDNDVININQQIKNQSKRVKYKQSGV